MAEGDCQSNGFRKVLVLNTTSVPINICSWRRALVLIFKGKAEAVINSEEYINNTFLLPLIVKLKQYVSVPYNAVVLTRKNIYLRDNHTCQYCGKVGVNLTIDHVVPKSKRGTDSWENVVVSCMRCNNRKGDRTPDEAGLKLIGTPYKPPSALYLQLTRLPKTPASWHSYFFKSPSRASR